jgi:DNA-binding XRE family transcriptional regulator
MGNTNFDTLLIRYRKANKLRQAELAQKLQVSQATINLWESDKCKPSAEHEAAIIKLLNTPLNIFDEEVLELKETIQQQKSFIGLLIE